MTPAAPVVRSRSTSLLGFPRKCGVRSNPKGANVKTYLVIFAIIGTLAAGLYAARASICTTNCMPTGNGGQQCTTVCL